MTSFHFQFHENWLGCVTSWVLEARSPINLSLGGPPSALTHCETTSANCIMPMPYPPMNHANKSTRLSPTFTSNLPLTYHLLRPSPLILPPPPPTSNHHITSYIFTPFIKAFSFLLFFQKSSRLISRSHAKAQKWIHRRTKARTGAGRGERGSGRGMVRSY